MGLDISNQQEKSYQNDELFFLGFEIVKKNAGKWNEWDGRRPRKYDGTSIYRYPDKAGSVKCKGHRMNCPSEPGGESDTESDWQENKEKDRMKRRQKTERLRKGKGTRNAIFVLRMIRESAIEFWKYPYFCYMYFQNVFDTVKHKKMMEILRDIAIDGNNIQIVSKLYLLTYPF